MSDSDDDHVPEVTDYGDAHEDFVDELARIDEDGAVSHLTAIIHDVTRFLDVC
jgi:hypothetical protein